MKFTILAHPSLVIITIYLVCLINALERRYLKRFLKEMMHFHYDLHGHALAQKKTPAPGVKKFTIPVDPSLVIITTYLVCLIYALESKEEDF